jgi:uncharacterized protein with ParB-like and HNH nuclease domain
MINSNIFKTEVISLSKVNNTLFCIPTYQRPYVWQEEQISKLLSDCLNSFKVNPEKPYYLGTILTDKKSKASELIDGQQRFTTLWLLAFSFNYLGIQSDLSKFLKFEDKLRLDFEIRTEIKEYFELLLKHPNEALNKYSEKEITSKPYLKNIVEAITIIKGILNQIREEVDLMKFGNFLYYQVLLVNNTTPNKIDLNKLFATINNSGVQLEQTDIVKANLLKKVTSQKVLYSKIWESCENMDDYFERNVRKIFNTSNWRKLEKNDFYEFEETKFTFENKVEDSLLSKGYFISQIVNKEVEQYEENNNNNAEDDRSSEINCRSIINFGQLLLHTFRIFLFSKEEDDFNGTFHVNRLIEVFKYFDNTSEDDVKDFILLLWKVRAVFDFHIIKWITDLDSKEEHLELTSLHRHDQRQDYSYFGRNVSEKSEELMLQSVLYFTGDYLRQFWLTPYLNHLISNQKSDLEYLELLDNDLSLSNITDKETSYLWMDYEYRVTNKFNYEDYLNEANGTSFRHYWFQKVEYLLWKKLNSKKDWEKDLEYKFKNFRITSKNSVEHIYPQQPQFQDKLEKEYLDNFGNLVLLSVSQNSEYSRKSVKEKREAFFNKPTFDSLKSFWVFKNLTNDWTKESINIHRSQILEVIKKHYNNTKYA